MKLTNADLTQSFLPALRELSTIRTNAKVAYNTVKTIKTALSAVEDFDSARKTLLENSAQQENGKPKIDEVKKEYVFVSDEVKEAVVKSLNELALAEVEFEIFPIKLSEFGNSEISAQLILSLKDFIVE
jgi:hypothetical protein